MKGADKLLPGTVISGKWNRHTYTVLKSLGKGANGAVYLVQSSRGLEALKLSDNSMSITSEVNVLKHFSKVQGKSLGPRLYDTDDWADGGGSPVRSFYVMEYIKGLPFLDFIQANGREWIQVLMLQLLGSLSELHKAGWAFGDLKPENLIVGGTPAAVRIIDVGGTTGMGRSIKEFTEFFDRGYWGMGMRKAEPQYDLFAAAMIALNAGTGERFSKTENAQQFLFDKIDSVPLLAGQKKVWRNALTGKYNSAEEMKKELLECISAAGEKKTERTSAARTRQRGAASPGKSKAKQTQNTSARLQRKSSHSGSLMDTFIVVSGAFILYALYIYHFLLP